MIQLYHGDCMDFIKTLPDKSIDLVVTDPPYNFGSKGGGFYSESNDAQRTYIKSLDKINCCDFKPIPFLNLIKPKMKRIYIYIYIVIKLWWLIIFSGPKIINAALIFWLCVSQIRFRPLIIIT